MVRTTFSGREIAKVLKDHGYIPVDRTGSHLKLRYEHPETSEVESSASRCTPDKIPTGTMHSIASQCGANDFHAWCEWIDTNR